MKFARLSFKSFKSIAFDIFISTHYNSQCKQGLSNTKKGQVRLIEMTLTLNKKVNIQVFLYVKRVIDNLNNATYIVQM